MNPNDPNYKIAEAHYLRTRGPEAVPFESLTEDERKTILNESVVARAEGKFDTFEIVAPKGLKPFIVFISGLKSIREEGKPIGVELVNYISRCNSANKEAAQFHATRDFKESMKQRGIADIEIADVKVVSLIKGEEKGGYEKYPAKLLR